MGHEVKETDRKHESAGKQILSSQDIADNHELLEKIGFFSYVEKLTREIRDCKILLSRGLDILNRTTIDGIMDATVKQLSEHFYPAFIAFLWKPVQNRTDITIRGYKDSKPVDLDIRVDNITSFEGFFRQYPKPIIFSVLEKKLNDSEYLLPLKTVQPEMVIPIIGPFGLYGIVLVGHKVFDVAYTKEELTFIEQLMSFVSQAIKNHLHYEHSLRDVKTGLYNHGFFMTRLKEEHNRIKRRGTTSSIIMIDVDMFKNFNDTYGHLAGDQVLERLAQVIRQNVRDEDIPSRFGGEEFTVLLPRTEIQTAWGVAERLRANVSDMQVPWEVPLPQVTISLGVYAFGKDSDFATADIIRRTDEALYVSKSKGRNCSTIWDPELIEKFSPKE